MKSLWYFTFSSRYSVVFFFLQVHYNSKTSFFETSGSSNVSSADLGIGRSSSGSAAHDRPFEDVFPTAPPTSLPLFDQSRLLRRGQQEEEGGRTGESISDGGETSSVTGGSGRKAVKKANLYTWLSLQTLPEVSWMEIVCCCFSFFF